MLLLGWTGRTEVYPDPRQAFKIERFAIAKHSILDVWQVFDYASAETEDTCWKGKSKLLF